MSLYGGVAPYELKGMNWDEERENFTQNVMNVMDEFAPGFSDSVLDAQLLLKPDIERIVGMPGGNTQHGELTLNQMFFHALFAGLRGLALTTPCALPMQRVGPSRRCRLRGTRA